MLLWILSVAMAFSLGIMALWQLWLIAKGETTVEAHDNGKQLSRPGSAVAKLQGQNTIALLRVGAKRCLKHFD